MTRSSRHKSHKQSKHKDYYSDSDEDVVKMDRTSYKDEVSVRSHRDSASGEKRKVVSLVREGKEVLDEYVSSKRRKEKWDVVDDRWNGGGEDVEKEGSVKVESKSRESGSKGEVLRVESKVRESGSSKGEVLRVESKSKSRRHESERKNDGLVEKEESKGKGESRRKSEKDYSSRREKESKDKERKSEKESKREDEEVKLVEVDVGKKEVLRSGDVSEDRHGKRSRSNADRAEDGSWNPELEKESEKKIHKSREASSERDKHRNDSKEASERRLSTRSDRAKETKHGDDKKKAESYADKNQDDVPKDVRQRDDKNRKESDKDTKWDDKNRKESDKDTKWDDKNRKESDKDTKYLDARYREDGDKGHRDDKREDSNKDHRRKDEKHRDKYKEGTEREHRDDKYYKDDRYHEDDHKDNRKDEKYYEDGERDNRVKDGQHREDVERDVRRKDKKHGDDFDRENRQKSTKYRDDGYAADHHHSRKSKAYDDSPTRDDRTSARYRDDQVKRKLNDRDDYGDVRSRGTNDQRSNIEKKSATIDVVTERGRSTSRTADIEPSSGHSRRRSSPGLSSHDARDHFRVPKQDEDRVRHNTSSTREYAGTGGSEKNSPWSLEKNGQKGDAQFGEMSGERRRNSDIRPSSLQRHDKSPSSNNDKRQFSRSDVRSTGFRDASEYTGKEGRDVLPGNDFSQADTDTVSVSSPSVRNSYFSNSSKSFPPPPHFKAGMDSPFPLNSTEDDSRGKSNNRQRRPVDPNMGRMPGNAWRGLPSWPSPMPNGYMPYHHAPPPAGFMQPFPTPPIFGVRPSMELNHPLASPYHIPDADRFSAQVHPMWRNQVNGPFSSWDPSGSGFGDETHNYGRPNWDPSVNMPGVRGWGPGGDMWKGSNKTASLEKENDFTRSEDQSVKPAQSEQAQVEQAESTGFSQPSRSGEKNEVDAPVIGQEDGSDKSSEKGDLCLSHVYLSRLDISADLVEPEVFDRCSVLIDMDQSVVSDVDDSKILCMEEAVESEVAPHAMLNYTLFPSTDESVFQKAMALYKRQRDSCKVEVGEKIPSIPSFDQEDQLAENIETEKVSPTDDMQGVEVDLINNSPMLEMEVETTQKETDQSTDAEITEKSEEHESVKLPDASLPTELDEVSEGSENRNQEVDTTLGDLNQEVDTKLGDLNQEVDTKLGDLNQEVDTKLGDPILNNDVSSEVEAVMHESVVSGPVNLSRIHHSPESTH